MPKFQHLPHPVCPLRPSVVSLGVAQGLQVPPGVGLYSSRGQGVHVTSLLSYPAEHPEKEMPDSNLNTTNANKTPVFPSLHLFTTL